MRPLTHQVVTLLSSRRSVAFRLPSRSGSADCDRWAPGGENNTDILPDSSICEEKRGHAHATRSPPTNDSVGESINGQFACACVVGAWLSRIV